MSVMDFSTIPVFHGLDAAEIGKVESIFHEETRPAGSVVVAEGQTGEEMYILVRGRVQISKAMLMAGMSVPLLNMASPRKVLATLDDTSHPVFGEVALIDSDQRSATVTAITDSTFLVTSREQFFDLARREPELGVKLLLTLGKRMAATIRRSNAEVVKLTTALALSLRKSVT
ncbi:MAG: cyclic nucleotide-binding domain-containing protein [Humidesulfovibrio sp.]|uniref:cyclic nucleotide-binding domain-containing protein n=1 Tax=Humidesulfovibrio sp. TaxID=2910988 RepID=UPI0027EE3416|nr:cyclic nucleotide-binding domain-containing protein [Humidesulfovibrio sp.]MDQ7833899.1 cyclic nucleotide-binding domain-containing protein [Humidesulfovibrio sp.]